MNRFVRLPRVARWWPLVAAGALGCGGETKPPTVPESPRPQAQTTSTSVARPPAPTATQATSGVSVSGEILAACRIVVGDVDKSPEFDFDASELRQDDRTVLAKVATCVTTGPLRGRSLRLTGRADVRGEEEYNMNLGAARAASVGSYLEQSGVPAGQLDETSRGELDATGTDEAGFQRDRRVDVDLRSP
jgi:peptidoglycan-associated lipoprotein